MNERDFEIGPLKFKLNKIDAFKQFHIVRRLAPILGDMIPIAQKLHQLKKENLSEEQMFAQIAELSTPIFNGISKLSDADADKVLLGLCSAVEMQQTAQGGWARVSNGEILMFQNLELPQLMQIAGRAFAYNMAGFFASMPQASPGGK